MAYSKEMKKEHTALIKQILIIKPDASIRQVVAAMTANARPLSFDYVMGLMRKIRAERARRYERATAKEAIAKFEDLVKNVEEELRKLKNETSSDMVKAIALSNIVKHKKELLNLQFDAGVFERKLGTLNAQVVNVAEILKVLEDAERYKKTGGHNSIIEGEQ